MPDTGSSRRRSSLPSAWARGWQRALSAPLIPLGILAFTVVLALPLTIAIRDQVGADMGAVLAATRMLDGGDAGGVPALTQDASGPGTALTHVLIGLGGSLVLLGHTLRDAPLPGALIALTASQSVLWLFLWGGILDRYAGTRRGGPTGFLRASGAYAFRFLRLAVAGGIACWLIAGLPAWAALPLLTMLAITMDLARVRTVVEDRRSMVGAMVAAVRFIRRRPLGVGGLLALNLAALALLVIVWSAVAPSPAASPWTALALTQSYLLARLWTRLALTASLLSLVQAEFRPAATTDGDPVWPDAPAAVDDLL